jgi:hypothetical protein
LPLSGMAGDGDPSAMAFAEAAERRGDNPVGKWDTVVSVHSGFRYHPREVQRLVFVATHDTEACTSSPDARRAAARSPVCRRGRPRIVCSSGPGLSPPPRDTWRLRADSRHLGGLVLGPSSRHAWRVRSRWTDGRRDARSRAPVPPHHRPQRPRQARRRRRMRRPARRRRHQRSPHLSMPTDQTATLATV